MVVSGVALCALFVSLWKLPEATAAEGAREPARPPAEMTLGASRIDWQPAADVQRLTLTVTGPEGLWITRDFEAGQPPSLTLSDLDGERLSDGSYTWELRVVSPLGKLPQRTLVESGHFFVKNGSFVAARRKTDSPRPPRLLTAEASFVDGDLSVKGNACIGASCTVDDATYPSLRIKAPQPNILFDDEFVEGGSTPHDWALFINPSSAAEFSIADVGNQLIPFTIVGGAPTSSLYMASSGNLGLGTATPAKDIHAMSGNTPTLRLEQDGSGGLSPRTWDIGANNTELFVKDVTNSSSAPFRIKAGAPSDRLTINNVGVGVGTASPQASFHVNAGEVRFPPGAGAVGFTHFNLYSDGKNYIRGTTIIADNGGSVGIGTTSPSSKLHVNGGDIRVSGGSFIDDGVTLNAPDYVFEPSYSLMPLAELREFVSREKHLPNVPAAADIKKEGLNLSQFQMRLLEKIEELALYTLQQEEDVRSLRDENRELKARLEALENAQTSGEPK
jgi:hypothetical protein